MVGNVSILYSDSLDLQIRKYCKSKCIVKVKGDLEMHINVNTSY